MKAHPGAQLASTEIVGRDELIVDIWEIVAGASILLTAERRMGKTSVIKKMATEGRDGFIAIYHDLEGHRSPLEFVQTVYDDVAAYLAKRNRLKHGLKRFGQHMAGLEISCGEYIELKLPERAAPHWKKLLRSIMHDLVDNQDHTLVFMWDEFPMMLDNIKQDHGETEARAILDVLRELRQHHGSLRMLMTGSIGIHHVLTDMKRKGYRSTPLNDLHIVTVDPLTSEYARELAVQLIGYGQVPTTESDAIAAAIADGLDGVPFYIHHCIKRLKSKRKRVDLSLTAETIDELICDEADQLDLEHFVTRLSLHYDTAEQLIARAILDALASADEPLTLATLADIAASRITGCARKQVLEMLNILHKDHYVRRHGARAFRYSFRLTVVARYWRIIHGLEE